MSVEVNVTTSLRRFPEEQLDRVTADASVFFDTRWFRLIDGLDLSRLVGGEVRLRFVTASRDGRLVAVCPMLVCPDPSVYFFYSLERYYFRHWEAEAIRLAPERRRRWRWLGRLARAYRRVAQLTGARTDRWVLAASPLSHRGDVALAPMPESDRRAAIAGILEALQDVARGERAPLCFFAVEEGRSPLRAALTEGGFEEIFLVYDNLVSLRGVGEMDEYLGRFRSDARRRFGKELDSGARNGIRFETVHDLAGLAPQLAELYRATYARYGEDHLYHPPDFWAALSKTLGPSAEALLAWRGRRLIGFSLLLGKKDLWFYRVGRSYDDAHVQDGVYFNLAFYGPIRRALERGCERLWLGAGAWEAKHRRGALGSALYSYFWFPARRQHALLMPYLRGFGEISQAQMAHLTHPTSALRRDASSVPAPHYRTGTASPSPKNR